MNSMILRSIGITVVVHLFEECPDKVVWKLHSCESMVLPLNQMNISWYSGETFRRAKSFDVLCALHGFNAESSILSLSIFSMSMFVFSGGLSVSIPLWNSMDLKHPETQADFNSKSACINYGDSFILSKIEMKTKPQALMISESLGKDQNEHKISRFRVVFQCISWKPLDFLSDVVHYHPQKNTRG